MKSRKAGRRERGAGLVEFALAATAFFIVLFAALEVSRLYWTHNALADGVRKGARYAALTLSTDTASVKNMVVYGTPSTGTQPIVPGLTTSQVEVIYTNFGVGLGNVKVRLTGHTFKFALPMLGATINMPKYETTFNAESAGYVPAAIN